MNPGATEHTTSAQDFYATDAEWYAPAMRPVLRPMRDALHRLLPPGGEGDVAVDVGAGVGAFLPAFRAAGYGRLYAVEPSAAMRTGLMTFVAFTEDLAPVTTVLTGTLQTTAGRLPDRWSVVALMNAIGHLTDDEEHHLWTTLRQRLTSEGRFVVSLQPPATPTEVPRTDFGDTTLGDLTWSLHGSATPMGPGHVEWTTERTLTDAKGTVIEQRTSRSPWRTTSPEQLLHRARDAGFSLVDSDEPMAMYAFSHTASSATP